MRNITNAYYVVMDWRTLDVVYAGYHLDKATEAWVRGTCLAYDYGSVFAREACEKQCLLARWAMQDAPRQDATKTETQDAHK